MDASKKSFETAGGVERHDTEALRIGEERVFTTYIKGRVLDLGCGTGRTTVYLARTCEVIGVDYSEAMIRRAKELHPLLDLRVMDARKLEFPDESFDAVFFSFDGIDYLYPFAERLKGLREIRRVLKPGSVFAFTSNWSKRPMPNNPRRVLGWLYALSHGIHSPYFSFFTGYGFLVTYAAPRETQLRTLQQEGFELVEDFPTKPGEQMYVVRKSSV
ncbi:MAG TPA: class I SAM-dependent methyltransferase [Candidatus Paceibacterota bacterium]|nr:class I SAM-dependent methyltransferase [Candidatus Paceibacterota bacterium]